MLFRSSSAGPDAKALAGAAQKVLAGEIESRAAKLAQEKDEHFVLATDGIIRWHGQAVGRIVAAEEVLKPRVRVLPDDHLTGASRDIVQARLDLWLKTHIERFLGPLLQVANAEDITGIARGVAFQLAESLGVTAVVEKTRRLFLAGQTLLSGVLLVAQGALMLGFHALLTALVLRPWETGFAGVWSTLTEARVLAALRLSFGTSLLAALTNVPLGLMVAWTLTRYEFPGRRIVDAFVDLPFALPTAVAGIALTAIGTTRGQALVHGEYWMARSAQSIDKGERVRVVERS